MDKLSALALELTKRDVDFERHDVGGIDMIFVTHAGTRPYDLSTPDGEFIAVSIDDVDSSFVLYAYPNRSAWMGENTDGWRDLEPEADAVEAAKAIIVDLITHDHVGLLGTRKR